MKPKLIVLDHVTPRQLLRAAVRIDSRRLPEHASAIHLAILARADAERRPELRLRERKAA